MTVRKLLDTHYEMSAGETKPTDTAPVATIREIDTNKMWITYDGGANWAVADKRMRLVEQDGTFIDLPAELAAIVTACGDVETAVAALGYEFTVNGVNFNGHANIKMLTLDSNAKDDVPVTLKDAGVDYQVGTGKVFIAFQALIWLEQTAMVGRIGESDTAGGVISKEVLKFSHGVQVPFMESCIGVFAADKWVTAETDSNNASYEIDAGSVLYGVEVDA